MKNKRIKLMPGILLTDEELKQLIRAARGVDAESLRGHSWR
jgi:hypothetical protein